MNKAAILLVMSIAVILLCMNIAEIPGTTCQKISCVSDVMIA